MLTTEDARAVEAAFEAKHAELPTDLIGPEPMSAALPISNTTAAPEAKAAPEASTVTMAGSMPGADSVPTVAGAGPVAETGKPRPARQRWPITKTVRHRNKEHLNFVRTQPCLVCGRQPCDPHHLRFAEPRARGRKVSDEFAVPLCRVHHREAHRTIKEMAWWQALGIAPLEVADGLWQKTQSGQALQEAQEQPQPQQPPAALPIQRSLPSADADSTGSTQHKPLPG